VSDATVYKTGVGSFFAFFADRILEKRMIAAAGSETKIQGFVHSLDQGKLARIIRLVVVATSVVALAAAYLFLQFRGLSSEVGMDQAQVARQLAHGNGFSTKTYRLLAMEQLQNANRSRPLGRFPDTFNAPLNPIVNAIALRLFSGLAGPESHAG